jgi:small subunit ribosomal protein S16
MLVIRLQRTGRSNLATYRVVLAEKSSAAKGKFQEILGHYLPAQKTPIIKIDAERAAHWIKLGAVPSDTVARLLQREGAKGMDKFISTYTKKKSKNAPAEEPAKPAASASAEAAPVEAAPVEAAAEAPAVEVKEEAAPEVKAEEPVAEA